MGLPLIAAAGKAVGAGINYFTRKKRPKFGKTSYAKRLKERMKTGDISGQERGMVMSRVGQTAGNVANVAKTNFKGNLISRGMEGSVAGLGKMADIDARKMDQLSDTSRSIDVQNIQSKNRAKDTYAQAKTAWKEGRRNEDNAATSELFGGLTGAATGYIGDKMNIAQQQQGYAQQMAMSQPQIVRSMDAYKSGNMDAGQLEGVLISMGLDNDLIDEILAAL